MCIRDSYAGGWSQATYEENLEKLRQAVGKAGLTTVGEPVPVSYTHLRAHETVLDLVCRLLLEKKKQKRNIIR